MPLRREPADKDGLRTDQVSKALDALVGDSPVASADLAVLSDAERAEVGSLARTAHLTKIVLHSDSPDDATEGAALSRALTALENRKSSAASSQARGGEGRSGSWFGHLFDRRRDSDGDRG